MHKIDNLRQITLSKHFYVHTHRCKLKLFLALFGSRVAFFPSCMCHTALLKTYKSPEKQQNHNSCALLVSHSALHYTYQTTLLLISSSPKTSIQPFLICCKRELTSLLHLFSSYSFVMVKHSLIYVVWLDTAHFR